MEKGSGFRVQGSGFRVWVSLEDRFQACDTTEGRLSGTRPCVRLAGDMRFRLKG